MKNIWRDTNRESRLNKLPYKTNARKNPETQSLKIIIIEIGKINTGRLNTKIK